MNRSAVVLLIIAALLILISLVALIGKARGATPSATVTVTATLVRSIQDREPPFGLRGDRVDQSWRLNHRQGNTIGRMLLTCRWILRTARFCFGQVELPTGVMTVAGSSPSRFAGTYVVTGGTGGYLGVGGAMRFTAVGARKTVLLVTITT